MTAENLQNKFANFVEWLFARFFLQWTIFFFVWIRFGWNCVTTQDGKQRRFLHARTPRTFPEYRSAQELKKITGFWSEKNEIKSSEFETQTSLSSDLLTLSTYQVNCVKFGAMTLSLATLGLVAKMQLSASMREIKIFYLSCPIKKNRILFSNATITVLSCSIKNAPLKYTTTIKHQLLICILLWNIIYS
jgi:hypothetical protein